MKQRLPTAIAIVIGLATLVGYFISPYLPGYKIHHLFIGWAAILVAVAFLLGVLNLLNVHLSRVLEQKKGWFYSLFLVCATALVIIIAVVEQRGPNGAIMVWVFENALVPLEASAASLLVFFLAASAFRTMRKKPTAHTFLFVLTAVLVMLSAIPLSAEMSLPFSQVRDWLVRVFATAGARGMLLGVALGTITTGVRVLLGVDRPHSEQES